jgi:hypothetical protein
MRGLVHPVLAVARSAVYGYVAAFLMIVFAIVMVSVLALVASVPRVSVGIGPLPLMSFWHSGSGNGFQSEWGVVVLAFLGAAVGAAVAVRGQQRTRVAR